MAKEKAGQRAFRIDAPGEPAAAPKPAAKVTNGDIRAYTRWRLNGLPGRPSYRNRRYAGTVSALGISTCPMQDIRCAGSAADSGSSRAVAEDAPEGQSSPA